MKLSLSAERSARNTIADQCGAVSGLASSRTRRSRQLVLAAALSSAALIACSSKAPDPGLPFGTGATGGASGPSGGSGGGSSEVSGGQTFSSGGTTHISVPTSNSGTGAGGAAEASGGGGGVPPKMVTEQCASSQATSTDITSIQPADIIFAIDTSGSMTEEIRFTQEYMNEFSQLIVDSGIDVRVIMIAGASPGRGGGFPGRPAGGAAGAGGAGGAAGTATDGGTPGTGTAGPQGQSVCIGPPLGSGNCPDDTKLPNYVHIDQYVGSNDVLDVIINSYPKYKEYLRPNASKSFVVISDDNATTAPNNSAKAFSDALAALDPTLFATWSFNGVFCFTRCAGLAAAVGTVFQDLVTQTSGIAGDLCEQDFQPVFQRLAKQIVMNSGSKISCEWDFPPPPSGQSFSTELVRIERTGKAGMTSLTRVKSLDACVPGGWYYDDAVNPKKILACPDTCMDLQNDSGGKIDIAFDCEQVGACAATNVGVGVGATALSCDWELPVPPSGTQLDFDNVNVRFTNEAGFATTLGKVGSAADCAMFDLGWHYDDANNPKRILACPDTCSKLQQGGAMSKIDVLLGCESIPAPPR